MEKNDELLIQLKAENELLKNNTSFLEDSLKDSIQGLREQSSGYQKTIRYVITVCALMVVLIILGLSYQYFKFAYSK